MNRPFFSVVIPTFNRAHLLTETILSVKNQSLPDWELLLIDDGSSDGTDIIVRDIQKNDSRVRFFQRSLERTKGPSSCRNIGIENSRSEFVAFLDSDDSWESSRLENIWKFIQKTKAEAIYSGAKVKKTTNCHFRSSRPISPDETVFDFLLKSDSFIPTPSIVIDRNLANEIKFNENLTHHEDYDFIVRAAAICSWTFYSGHEVVVDWKDQPNRKINYENCLWFFNSYRATSKDKKARVDYLLYMVQDMVVRGSNYHYLHDYRKLLIEEDFDPKWRDLLMFNLPRVYHFVFTILNQIKAGRK